MRRPLFAVCLVITCVIALYNWIYPPSLPDIVPEEAAEITLYGRIDRKESRSFYGKEQLILYLTDVSVRYFEDDSVDDSMIAQLSGQKRFQNQILCYVTSAGREPKTGSFVLLRGKAEDFDRATNPGQFDSRLYYASRGIDFAVKRAEILWESDEYSVFKELLWRLRVHWCKRLDRVMEETGASVMKTMLLGDKASLDSDIKELYRDGGISHILAISGMHISMIGMGLYKMLRKMGVPIWLSAVLGSLCIFAYGMMTGAGTSAGRAVGMFLIRMLAEVLGRNYDMLTALGVLLLWMVCDQPLYLYHPGFLLSFTAILALGLLAPALEAGRETHPRYREGREKKRYLLWEMTRGNFVTGTAVTLLTLPITFWYFYEAPVYGVLLNLLVLPLVPAVMYLGVTVLLLPEGIWLRVLAAPLEWLLEIIETLCQGSRFLPGGDFIRGRPQVWQIVIYIILLAAVVLGKRRLPRKGRWVLLGIAMTVLCIKVPGEPAITFLDVGQGDAIIVQAEGGKTYLVDCGSSSENNVGKYVVSPFLKQAGIDRLEAVFVTHPDKDHCNGLSGLFETGYGARIGRLILPAVAENSGDEACLALITLAEDYDIPVYYMGAGMQWQDGETQFLCLHPEKDFTEERQGAGSWANRTVGNADSLVLYLRRGNFSALLTGDVEGDGEINLRAQLQQYGIDEVSVLKVAHHGSKYSTTEAFLGDLDGQVAVISCGKSNPYGHPHEELLKRLSEEKMVVLSTSKQGAIRIRMQSGAAGK